jgi:hypothetical protein
MCRRWIGIWCLMLIGNMAFAQNSLHQQDADIFADSMLKASKSATDEGPEYFVEEDTSTASELENAEADYDETDVGEEDTEESESQALELRRISDEDWKKVLADTSFKYNKNKVKTFKKISKPSPWIEGLAWFLNSGFFKFLLYLLIGSIVLFVVYSIFSNSDIRFKNLFSSKGKKQEDYAMENVEEFNDWDKALQEALRQADYRAAMRVLYLSLLHQMNEKSHIRLQHEKTNWDYVQECTGQAYHSEFIVMTRYFDYVWYGEFALQENSFGQLHDIAKGLLLKIKES